VAEVLRAHTGTNGLIGEGYTSEIQVSSLVIPAP
jgi:hypothetical protein